MARDSTETRGRIVGAAIDLFYGEGVRSVSVAAVAEKAQRRRMKRRRRCVVMASSLFEMVQMANGNS